MDAISLTDEIDIEGAHYDSCVCRPYHMQMNEMLSVQGQKGSTIRRSKSQNIIIGLRLAGITSLIHRQNIVIQLSELNDNGIWKILI